MSNEELNKLTDKHWEWVEGLLDRIPDLDVSGMEVIEYLYKTAFKHGYKHGRNEDA